MTVAAGVLMPIVPVTAAPTAATARRSALLTTTILLGSLPSMIETWMHCFLLTARG
jgi:hypothetical protein